MPQSFAAKDGTLLNDEQLHHITRNIREFIPKSDTESALNELYETLNNVLHTASDATQSGTIRIASWNALCAFIDQLVISESSQLRNILWSDRFWFEGCNLYIEQAPFSKPKPSRQLLSSLTNALEKGRGDRQSKQYVLDAAVQRLIQLLVSTTDADQVRTCAAIISHFLSKRVLSIGQLESSLNDVHGSPPKREFLSNIQDFLLILFQWSNKADLGSVIGILVSNLLDRLADQTGLLKASQNLPMWIIPLEQATSSGQVDTDGLRVHILPVLFQRSLQDYATLLLRLIPGDALGESSTLSTSNKQNLLYATLQTGKDLGILSETEDVTMLIGSSSVFIPFGYVNSLMQASDRGARLTGFSMLVKSSSMTKPFEKKHLQCIRSNLNQLLADTDANFRSEVASLIQRLLDRLRAITAMLARSIAKYDARAASDTLEHDRMLLDSHRQFLDWLICACSWELRPTASYQRHISALKCLTVIVRSGVCKEIDKCYLSKAAQGHTQWPFEQVVITKDLRRCLLDLLVDPFEDVRLLAANILEMAPVGQDRNSFSNLLRKVIRTAERSMLETGRADQADGVAHLYKMLDRANKGFDEPNGYYHGYSSVRSSLLCQLENMLNIAKEDISKAVQCYPIHGILTALRFILGGEASTMSNDHLFIARMSSDLHCLWQVVKPILCDDAPEGYMLEGVEELAVSSTRDTLNFCWRALKEASLLLGLIISWTDVEKLRHDSDYSKVILPLSELCFQQLAELRHRGAFSTVAQTWIECCIRCRCANINGKPVLEMWFERVLRNLRNNTVINTRRSAGLPSLVCGILIAAKDVVFFELAFISFDSIARVTVDSSKAQEGSLPQVHAMNCLKDIFKNTRLAETSERFVPAALKLAADALRSEAWAVRNCGLMLFRGVIDRLLGTNGAILEEAIDSQKIITEEQCPGLLGVVLSLLSFETNILSPRHEGVFPGLQLLQRVKIPEQKRNEVLDSVLELTGSSVWHVRDKAARTFASFITRQESAAMLEYLLLRSTGSQNILHGALLCARYVVAKTLSAETGEELYGTQLDFSRIILAMRNSLYHFNECLVTRGAYVDVLNELQIPSGHIEIAHSTVVFGDFDLITEMDSLIKTMDGFNLKAVLILALARAIAISFWRLDIESSSRLLNIISALATSDVDACAEFFKLVKSSFVSTDVSQAQQADLLVEIGIHILSAKQVNIHLKACVQETMLHLLCETSIHFGNISKLLEKLSLTRAQMQKEGNQSSCDFALQIRAVAFERNHLARDRHTNVDAVEFQALVQDCVSGMTEQGYYTREAVSLALQHLRGTWCLDFAAFGLETSLLTICMVLYDLLNDDDEDIRLQTSTTCARLLNSQDSPKICAQPVPLIVGSQLLDWMSRRWSSSSEFASVVLSRAFNPRIYSSTNPYLYAYANVDSPPPSAKALLAKLLDNSTALFAEEKQNLYIDSSREIRVWSLIANDLSFSAISSTTLVSLNGWTIDALATFIEQASQHDDGPLGWSTNVDVFALGLQMIYAAGWLLRVGERHESEIIDVVLIRKLLDEFGDAAAKTEVNLFWRRELAEIVR